MRWTPSKLEGVLHRALVAPRWILYLGCSLPPAQSALGSRSLPPGVAVGHRTPRIHVVRGRFSQGSFPAPELPRCYLAPTKAGAGCLLTCRDPGHAPASRRCGRRMERAGCSGDLGALWRWSSRPLSHRGSEALPKLSSSPRSCLLHGRAPLPAGCPSAPSQSAVPKPPSTRFTLSKQCQMNQQSLMNVLFSPSLSFPLLPLLLAWIPSLPALPHVDPPCPLGPGWVWASPQSGVTGCSA